MYNLSVFPQKQIAPRSRHSGNEARELQKSSYIHYQYNKFKVSSQFYL